MLCSWNDTEAEAPELPSPWSGQMWPCMKFSRSLHHPQRVLVNWVHRMVEPAASWCTQERCDLQGGRDTPGRICGALGSRVGQTGLPWGESVAEPGWGREGDLLVVVGGRGAAFPAELECPVLVWPSMVPVRLVPESMAFTSGHRGCGNGSVDRVRRSWG